MEQWIEIRKGGDFAGIGERFGIHPVVARILRNRELTEEGEIEAYLHGTLQDLHSPHEMKDMDKAVAILSDKLKAGKKLRIIGDYDIDGVNATYILLKALRSCGADVDYAIPNRITDGYGINRNLIEQALSDGIDTIVTCDNGIAAIEEISYAKSQGMTVIVTDHHDIPFEEQEGRRHYKTSMADAVINPKQQECPYPYKELCGAAVAFQFARAFYESMGKEPQEAMEFLENAAFATVGDVMNLTGENRILVKEGLKALRQTKNPGMRALVLQNNLEFEQLNTYHIGFVLGPCINASGRLDTAEDALRLLCETDETKAAAIAKRLLDLNTQRKELTAKQLELALGKIESEQMEQDRVLVIYLPDCHESLAGIIAGRIRERYYRPVFVLTNGEGGVKGSGRSIEEYSMYEEMNRVSDLFTKFGGHPMAAGLSMEESRVNEFRERINAGCTLTESDLTEKVRIDMAMPVGYPDIAIIEQLKNLEPFGKGNPKPLFADRNLHIRSARKMGKNNNAVRLTFAGADGEDRKAVYFGDAENFFSYLTDKFGEQEVDALKRGRGNSVTISVVYELSVDEYGGRKTLQLIIRRYR